MPPADPMLLQVWPLAGNHAQNAAKISKGLLAGYSLLFKHVEDHGKQGRAIIAIPTKNQVDGAYLDQIIDEANRRNLRRKGQTQLLDQEFPGVVVELHLMTAANDVAQFHGPILVIDPNKRLMERIHARHGDPKLIVVGLIQDELAGWIAAANPEVIDIGVLK